jgi:hypothetical protein
MRKIIVLVLVLLSCSTFAAAACRVVEYPDHNEAVCDGDAEQSPASSQKTEQELGVATEQTAESDLPDVPPEQIVRNELANLHAAAWLKSLQGH